VRSVLSVGQRLKTTPRPEKADRFRSAPPPRSHSYCRAIGGPTSGGLDLGSLRISEPGNGRPRGDGWAACETHRELIAGHLAHRVRLSKVRKLLRRRGVEVGYDTLRRFAMEQLALGTGAVTVPWPTASRGRRSSSTQAG